MQVHVHGEIAVELQSGPQSMMIIAVEADATESIVFRHVGVRLMTSGIADPVAGGK